MYSKGETRPYTWGLGAVLLQHCSAENKDFPVAYISRGLAKSEKNYDPKKLEGLAVVWAMDKLRHYLLGTAFEVHTDHANLAWILTSPHTGQPQIARWKAVLSEYDFKLSYKKDVSVADALSRDP